MSPASLSIVPRELIPSSVKKRQRKPKLKQIVDKVYPKVFQQPRVLIIDNITLYSALHKSDNSGDILNCVSLAKNILEQAKLLVEEAEKRRHDEIVALGGIVQ
jgi:hypothetical protein